MALWKLNNSSETLFNNCLEASHPQELWSAVMKSPALMDRVSRSTAAVGTQQKIQSGETYNPAEVDRLCDIVEEEPVENFQNLLIQCKDNYHLFKPLSKKLSLACIEKICQHVFSNEDLNSEFLYHFYVSFLPDFLSRNNLMSSMLIMNRSTVHSIPFNALLHHLISNVTIPNTLLKLYAENLGEDEKYNLLMMFKYVSSSSAVFRHHLITIYVLYKDLDPLVDMQDLIFGMLTKHGQLFVSDQDYGKLFLTYLKKHYILKLPVNYNLTSKCIDMHMSTYKTSCDIIFNNIVRRQQLYDDRMFSSLSDQPSVTSDYDSDA